MSEIKPCPFCGSEARVVARNTSMFACYVRCEYCLAAGPMAAPDIAPCRPSEPEIPLDGIERYSDLAIKRWNRRTTQED